MGPSASALPSTVKNCRRLAIPSIYSRLGLDARPSRRVRHAVRTFQSYVRTKPQKEGRTANGKTVERAQAGLSAADSRGRNAAAWTGRLELYGRADSRTGLETEGTPGARLTQGRTVPAQPVPCLAVPGEGGRDQSPVRRRMVKTAEVHQLVDEHVVTHPVGHQHQPPVE